MNLKYIYKIINKEDLEKARSSGTYLGSSKDVKDGYIHFSGQEQVKSIFKKHYSGEENLILLKVETLKLDHLIWEQSSNGNFFPHLYSALDLINVVKEYEVNLDSKGNHKLPDHF